MSIHVTTEHKTKPQHTNDVIAIHYYTEITNTNR
jgi:hypothetical protein